MYTPEIEPRSLVSHVHVLAICADCSFVYINKTKLYNMKTMLMLSCQARASKWDPCNSNEPIKHREKEVQLRIANETLPFCHAMNQPVLPSPAPEAGCLFR